MYGVRRRWRGRSPLRGQGLERKRRISAVLNGQCKVNSFGPNGLSV